jgi:hypothetical protein
MKYDKLIASQSRRSLAETQQLEIFLGEGIDNLRLDGHAIF